jgi:hypothetical protein
MGTPRALNGRTATLADMNVGEAIFYIPGGRSLPYSFGRDLPLLARIVGEKSGFPLGTQIQILQAEVASNGDVLIGFLAGEQKGACMLKDIEMLE